MDLISDSTEVVLAYTSTGLGHLRVTNALFTSAPTGVKPKLFKTRHSGAATLHRLTSMSPITRSILEWSQNGWPEEFFTRIYRWNLRRSGDALAQELMTLIEQEFKIVKTIVIVATHFGLAHQIAGAKEKLSRELGVKIILVVCVTDDSPQKLWYVEGADLLFVPSENTKKSLESYGKQAGLRRTSIEVIPYPLNGAVRAKLTEKEWKMRNEQLDPDSSAQIQISIPISGAAINLQEVESFMSLAVKKNPRLHFYVTCRENLYTADFIKRLGRKAYVSLITSKHDREIVTYYNELVTTSVFAFEITKPSEQAFKALISSKERGGMTLLFTEPVGRQEHDNLLFLKRHELIPSRGFVLPTATKDAVAFLIEKLHDKTFYNSAQKASIKAASLEVSEDGAEVFWQKLKEAKA